MDPKMTDSGSILLGPELECQVIGVLKKGWMRMVMDDLNNSII